MHTPHATHAPLNDTSPTGGSAPAPATAPAVSEQTCYDAGLLALRLVFGLSMAAHGAQKLLGWFGGNGLDATAQFFTSVGYPAGRSMATVAGLTELLGGLGLAVGLLTPLAGAAVLGTMVNAVAVTHGHGYFAPEGVEYAVAQGAGAAALALTGPGRWAADRLLPGLRTHRLSHGVAAILLAAVTAAAVLLLRS